VNLLQELRSSILSLTPATIDQHKAEMLAIVDSLSSVLPGCGNNTDARHQKLSPRERQVMTYILEGRRLKEIAAILDISVKTVTTHRSRLLRKLSVDDNLGLYRYGVRNGLIAV
jgi:DNA-binding CsgD family transcriptional regulator